MSHQADKKMRVDLKLVDMGLAPSRTKAQDLIRLGQVTVNGTVTTQPSQIVDPSDSIAIQDPNSVLKYVSRGGYKLAQALETCHVDVRNFNALDLGLSTGGFADCLLQQGARFVVGVDVGHHQVDSRLMENFPGQLAVLEGVHVRDLRNKPEFINLNLEAFDLITVDLSFISLFKVLPDIVQLMEPKTRLLALVKPQFELGAESLNRHGVVMDSNRYLDLEQKFRRELPRFGLEVKSYFSCELTGKDGNQEFFVHCQLSEGKAND